MYNNKKGIGVDDAVPLIIFIFVAAFGIFFFKLYEEAKSDKAIEDIQKQKNILEGHEVLIGYLKIFDEKGIDKAELITKSYIENDYKNLKEDMEKYFSARLGRLPAWHINVNYPNKNNIFYLQGGNYHSLQYNLVQADSIFIPIHGSKPEYITLQLSVGFK